RHHHATTARPGRARSPLVASPGPGSPPDRSRRILNRGRYRRRVRRVVEAISPPRLGTDFRWLLASSWTSNIGDGIGLAAGPLLIASATDDPLLVASAALLQRLPWLLFGLYAGVLADRLDRRVLVVTVNALRTAV